MKVAVLLTGNFRTWPKTKKSFMKFIGDNEVDLYIDTYDVRFMYHPAVECSLPDFNEEFLDLDLLRHYFSNFNLVDLNLRSFERSKIDFENLRLAEKFKNYHNNCYMPINNTLEALSKIKMHELHSCAEYAFVVKTRFDALYDIKLSKLSIGNRQIVYNVGNVSPNDWLFIGTSTDLIKMYEAAHKEFFNPVYDNSHIDPPHGIFREVMSNEFTTVGHYRIVKGLLRNDGFVDHYVPKGRLDYWRSCVNQKIKLVLRRVIKRLSR